MRKFFAIIFIGLFSPTYGQMISPDNGIIIEYGFGAFYGAIHNNIYVQRKSHALASAFHLNLSYKNERLSYGFKVAYYDYLSDGDSSVSLINAQAGAMQFTTAYSLIEKRKINLFINTGIGVGQFEYERLQNDGNSATIQMGGFSSYFGMGLNIHFTPRFGIFFQSGFSYHAYKVTDFSINGQSYDEFENRPLDQVNFNFRGNETKLGLRLHLGGKKKE